MGSGLGCRGDLRCETSGSEIEKVCRDCGPYPHFQCRDTVVPRLALPYKSAERKGYGCLRRRTVEWIRTLQCNSQCYALPSVQKGCSAEAGGRVCARWVRFLLALLSCMGVINSIRTTLYQQPLAPNHTRQHDEHHVCSRNPSLRVPRTGS